MPQSMFIPQNNPFCVKVRKSQYLQNSTFKHKNKQKSETNSTFSLMDETRTKVIFHEKQGRALMYILDIASLHLHKNEAWIRTYIFCNITFVKLNTFNTLLKIAVPWVNTELLHVTKPIWLHWMQFYITRMKGKYNRGNRSKVTFEIWTGQALS